MTELIFGYFIFLALIALTILLAGAYVFFCMHPLYFQLLALLKKENPALLEEMVSKSVLHSVSAVPVLEHGKLIAFLDGEFEGLSPAVEKIRVRYKQLWEFFKKLMVAFICLFCVFAISVALLFTLLVTNKI